MYTDIDFKFTLLSQKFHENVDLVLGIKNVFELLCTAVLAYLCYITWVV